MKKHFQSYATVYKNIFLFLAIFYFLTAIFWGMLVLKINVLNISYWYGLVLGCLYFPIISVIYGIHTYRRTERVLIPYILTFSFYGICIYISIRIFTFIENVFGVNFGGFFIVLIYAFFSLLVALILSITASYSLKIADKNEKKQDKAIHINTDYNTMN